MSPTPSILQQILRRLVLRLVLLLDAWLGNRAALLGARLRRLPAGHRHRAGLERELARLDRVRAILADPDNHADPRFRGLLAEIARVRNDAGRRALARRRIYPNIFFALPAARPAPVADLRAAGGRCTTDMG